MNMGTEMVEHVLSAAENPEEASRLASELMRDSEKKHPDPPEPSDDTRVSLPGGWVAEDGTLHREAEVSEMTGEVEEAVMRPGVRRNPAKMTSELLTRTVVSVGPVTEITTELLNGMLLGDLEALLLGVRRATYGDTFDLSVTCGNGACRHNYEVEYSLSDDVPVRTLDTPDRLFSVELRNGSVATVSLPTGEDQAHLWDVDSTNQAERNNLMIGRCLRSIDGVPQTGLSAVRKMSSADIRTLIKFVNDTAPGPRYEDVEQECPGCGVTSPLVIGLMELFQL